MLRRALLSVLVALSVASAPGAVRAQGGEGAIGLVMLGGIVALTDVGVLYSNYTYARDGQVPPPLHGVGELVLAAPHFLLGGAGLYLVGLETRGLGNGGASAGVAVISYAFLAAGGFMAVHAVWTLSNQPGSRPEPPPFDAARTRARAPPETRLSSADSPGPRARTPRARWALTPALLSDHGKTSPGIVGLVAF